MGDRDRVVFDRYLLANTARAEGPLHCGPDCRRYQLCAIRYLDYQHFDNCVLGQMDASPRTKAGPREICLLLAGLAWINGQKWTAEICALIFVIVSTGAERTISICGDILVTWLI